jgi:hypothetical protein
VKTFYSISSHGKTTVDFSVVDWIDVSGTTAVQARDTAAARGGMREALTKLDQTGFSFANFATNGVVDYVLFLQSGNGQEYGVSATTGTCKLIPTQVFTLFATHFVDPLISFVFQSLQGVTNRNCLLCGVEVLQTGVSKLRDIVSDQRLQEVPIEKSIRLVSSRMS